MLKKILLATSTAAAALGSTAVLADPPYWAPAHGWRAKHHHHGHHYGPYYDHYYAPREVYVAPQPVYVVPAPRVIYAAPPAPVYYPAPAYQPAPLYHPAPVYGAPSVSIRLNLPL